MISLVSCAMPERPEGSPRLWGGQEISVVKGSRLHAAVGQDMIREKYTCNYELNPDYEDRLKKAGLFVAARGPAGEVRGIELPSHPFYVATLFQPQLSSEEGRPHPLIVSFLRAASAHANNGDARSAHR